MESNAQATCAPKLGFYCVNGVLQACPRGYYCDSADGIPKPCPADLVSFCPEGSSSPQIVGEGRYVDAEVQEERICERGFYCTQGVRTPCPGGTFGETRGLSDAACSGNCTAGYFCPDGSISPEQEPCVGAADYCPDASAAPQVTDLGYYTPRNRTMQIECPIGSYCYCPAGDAKNPLTVPEGYYSDTVDGAARKTTRTECDHSLAEPSCRLYGYDALLYQSFTIVGDLLYRSVAKVCERGHYCIEGARFECAPGRYGASEGLTTQGCSGLCSAGYYCPAASIVSTQIECPSGAWYCPEGTGTPYPVQTGYYSSDDRASEHICEPGHFCVRGVKRAALASAACAGSCPAGYFCPEGTVVNDTWTCRDALALTTDDQTFRANNVADDSCVVHLLDVYPEQFLEFSIIGARREFDVSSWDLAHANIGRYEIANSLRWDSEELGFRSRSSDENMRKEVSNETLQSGWRPDAGPKTMCFWKKFKSSYIFGIDGLRKDEAENDYFFVGTHWSHRDRIYASAGPTLGGYGSESSVVASNEWIFYCLASGGNGGTAEAYMASPTDLAPKLMWSQNDNGADRGVLAGSTLSVEYGRDMSDAVYGGFIHWNAHLNASEILNAHQVTKYFYQNDARPVRELHCGAYPSTEWNQGFLGRHVGPVPSIHYEKDAQGNYQPVSNTPGIYQAKEFVVPNLPRALDNSEAMLFCPEGSPQPRMAKLGYYTNDARTVQLKCPLGSFCMQGMKKPCPAGTFGDREGLASALCSGYCPAGAACPEGTSKPLAYADLDAAGSLDKKSKRNM
ncbi:Hypothetical Protein FCC1311_000232 [Hondaea fermentalgiana]|uniref:Uncharacterized protein n=1 Tax=Hondaea fermentalgiana TaxID=2315210 RepID=A0A2R5G5T2_9STRA|nr:Hypothetical Protein FCC1311_000232 [Hondaea fermentalgiana]|eukprot:GBG23803.1 Hypothetical Protein FCC1311_000232 [Hondaea fermentalgiana]